MKKILTLSLIIFHYHIAISQINNDLIIEQIEKMAEINEEEVSDYSELIETYWSISENPININSDDMNQLVELKLLSIFQLENIKEYRKQFGDLQFVEELYEVDGLDNNTINMIKPLISFKNNIGEDKIKLKDIFRYGRNKILIEVNQCLNKKNGYNDIEDSLLYENPNAIYLGNSQRLYFRYNYSLKNRVEAGFVLEKDPGEYIFKSSINDSLRSLLGNRAYSFFDYFSFHLYIKDLAFVKTLAIGDYKLSLGQGLTMGSGVAFTAKGGSLLRQSKKISASKSANETNYLRGIANTLEYKNFELTLFYSLKNTDANIANYDSINNKPEEITSLQQSGLHRTYNEISNRRVITQQLYGCNISYRNAYFQVGYTLHKTDLSAELIPNDNVYNIFNFRGKSIINQGIDAYYIFKRLSFYGEIAMSDNMGLAAIVGSTIQPTGYIDLTILYRNYAKDYQCLYSNAFANGSNTRNEKGWYLSTSISLFANCKLITTIDFFRSEWFKNNAHAPSNGFDFDMQLNYQPDSNTLFFLEFRNKNKMKNCNNTDIFQRYLIDDNGTMLRFHASYNINKNIILKNRVEYHINKSNNIVKNSYLIYQDIIYNPDNKLFNLSYRYELFNTETGSVYAYENDILYAFAVGGLSGKGIRTYLVGKIKVFEDIQVSGKIGFTIYRDRNVIGDGLEKIDSNWKGDAKIQIVWNI